MQKTSWEFEGLRLGDYPEGTAKTQEHWGQCFQGTENRLGPEHRRWWEIWTILRWRVWKVRDYINQTKKWEFYSKRGKQGSRCWGYQTVQIHFLGSSRAKCRTTTQSPKILLDSISWNFWPDILPGVRGPLGTLRSLSCERASQVSLTLSVITFMNFNPSPVSSKYVKRATGPSPPCDHLLGKPQSQHCDWLNRNVACQALPSPPSVWEDFGEICFAKVSACPGWQT